MIFSRKRLDYEILPNSFFRVWEVNSEFIQITVYKYHNFIDYIEGNISRKFKKIMFTRHEQYLSSYSLSPHEDMDIITRGVRYYAYFIKRIAYYKITRAMIAKIAERDRHALKKIPSGLAEIHFTWKYGSRYANVTYYDKNKES